MRDGRDAYVSSRTLPYPPTLERYAKSWKKSILTREKHSGNKNIFDIKYPNAGSLLKIENNQIP